MDFLEFRFLDFIDIVLVAILFYQIYWQIKGTIAINIFIGIFFMYLTWLIVKALNMQLLGTILGQIMGVGVIALIVVFQQEVRRVFLTIGSKYFSNQNFSLERFFSAFLKKATAKIKIAPIVIACQHLSISKTGALIVIKNHSELSYYVEMGEQIIGDTTSRLIESIFFKNSPLHDGALIINGNKIQSAGCILPVSSNANLPKSFGLRHRAGIGITETTDCFVIIVSEETGKISCAQHGKVIRDISPETLTTILENQFTDFEKSAKTKKIEADVTYRDENYIEREESFVQ